MLMAPHQKGDTPQGLDRRPTAMALSVETLVRDVLDGRVRVPDWQRPLKWTPRDALKLLDSIYRGYPIGTLLLWKRDGPEERLRFGPVNVDARNRTDALYVVDGQQRITTLVRTLSGLATDDDPFAAQFDLNSLEVVSAESSASGMLPMTAVLDARRLLKWLRGHPNEPEDAAIDLGARIREYQIPAYVVETTEESVVREIFERSNDSGRSLQADEVFDGRFRALDGGTPSGLRDVAAELSGLGFGRVGEEQAHSMMLATQAIDITKVDPAKWNAAQARSALDAVLAAGRKAISLMVHDAEVPHISLLPYSLPLVALTRFFHAHPDPHPRNRTLLTRWVWRGATAGLHSGASVGLRGALRAIGDDEAASVQDLLSQVEPGRDVPFQVSTTRFRASTARSKLCALTLASLRPRNLVTGDLLPAEALEITAIANHAKGNLGSRVLHPMRRGGLRAPFVACESREVLDSHFVDKTEHELLVRGDIDAAIAHRGGRLKALVRQFSAQRTRWSESDRPPLDALWDDPD